MASPHFSSFAQASSKAVEMLRQEFLSLRTNKANPQMLDRIRVVAYGSEVPVNQVASIGAVDGRTLEIKPWDPSVLGDIEKAILKSDLGVSPTNDGKILRIAFPSLTQERRQELVKVAKKYTEDARVRIRNARREAQDEAISQPLKDKKIAEDEKFKRQQELDQLTNKAIAEAEQILGAKEKEILQV